MKKCEHFRDLILTDYIDGQLDKASQGNVEDHLLDCSGCRAFFKEIKGSVLFQQAAHQPVPDELWGKIRQHIEEGNQPSRFLEGFIDNLKGLMVFPKLVPVLATLVLMFLAGTMSLNTLQVQQAQEKDQGEYLVSLLAPTGTSADSSEGTTPIEHYFL